MNWLTAIAIHQDYLWALAGFLWLAVLVAWWFSRRREVRTTWIPWVAVSGLLVAVVELSLLNTPVKPKPFIPSRLAWDAALGLITGGLVASLVLCRASTRPARLAALAGLLALAMLGGWSVREVRPFGEARALRPHPASLADHVRMEAFVDPADVTGWSPLVLARLHVLTHAGGGWMLSILQVLAVGAWLRGPSLKRSERTGLILVAVAQICSTSGPLSDALGLNRESTQLSVVGPWSALVQMSAAGLMLVASRGWRESLRSDAPAGRLELKALGTVLALWLCFGLGLAWAMGVLARGQFETGALGRARSAALLIDTDLLARALGPAFRFEAPQAESTDQRILHAESSHLATGVLRPLEQTLARIGHANPDINQARISTLRSGWLVVCCSPADYPGLRTNVTLLRPITPELRRDWAERAATISRPYTFHYGELSFATAPLLTGDGRMLGWLQLEFGASVWLAHQAQARLLAFFVVGLGVALIVLFFQQRQETRLRDRAQQAEAVALEANRAKTAFLAKVSHELRTPIQSIIGYGELLAAQALPDTQARWLSAQHSQSRLLIRLVNDLIDLSALQSGAFRLTPRNTDLPDLVLSTIESLRPAAHAKSLGLALIVDPRLPRWWQCDTERLRQVVLNLTGNAIKFTSAGTVRVELTDDDAASGRLRLVVTDTGPGIATEDIPRLFRPFSRLEQSQHIEGSGLGLALAASLCTALGGSLDVVSDGHSGSTFTARFRLAPGAPPALPDSEFRSTLAGWQILVVDDNPMVRDLFVSCLQQQGALCTTAADGLAALELATQRDFHALVLDLSMPWLDGGETARRLRARPGRQPRIIGVSAHAGTEEREQALAAGMDAFLIKPVELSDLVRALTNQAPTETPPLDDGLLARFREQFQLEAPALRAGLRMDATDTTLLRRRVHYLKNSADVVRHRPIAEACRELEAILTAPDRAALAGRSAVLLSTLQHELNVLEQAAGPNP